MIARCYYKGTKQYADYGGRGITVCPQWRSDCLQFSIDMGPRPSGLTLERRDNNGNYTPENCYWATRKEQQRNQRCTIYVTVEGKQYKAADLADLSEHKVDVIIARAKMGLKYEQVIAKGKLKHLASKCPNGHEFTPDNAFIDSAGYRRCRICRNLAANRSYHNRSKI